MGKKQFQSQGKYARKATQAKKKRSNRPGMMSNAGLQSGQDDSANEEVSSTPLTSKRLQSSQTSVSYPYITSDLVHTAIIAGIAFVVLIILYFVL